jgi:hypothetical protein
MKRILIVALAFFLSACASSGSIKTTSLAPVAVDSAKSGAVNVVTAVAGREATADALKNAIISQLLSKKVFNSVVAEGQSDYLLKVNVVEVKEVTQAARILLGALAGQAKITAQVDVLDRTDSTVLGSMIANGESSGGHIMAGTTQEAIDLTAIQIADYLLRNRTIRSATTNIPIAK